MKGTQTRSVRRRSPAIELFYKVVFISKKRLLLVLCVGFYFANTRREFMVPDARLCLHVLVLG